MGEFDEPEMRWVEAHRDQILGRSTEAATEVVRAAGFRPIVRVPRPGVAFAAAFRGRSVMLICVDGVVVRLHAG